MSSRARCHFKFKNPEWSHKSNSHHSIWDDPRTPAYSGAIAFMSGFWVDKNLNLPAGSSDAKYWIPPSQIFYIEKVRTL